MRGSKKMDFPQLDFLHSFGGASSLGGALPSVSLSLSHILLHCVFVFVLKFPNPLAFLALKAPSPTSVTRQIPTQRIFTFLIPPLPLRFSKQNFSHQTILLGNWLQFYTVELLEAHFLPPFLLQFTIMASGILFPPVSFTGKHGNCRNFRIPARNSVVLLNGQKFLVRSSLDKDVSDMSVNGKFYFILSVVIIFQAGLCFSIFYRGYGRFQYTLFLK